MQGDYLLFTDLHTCQKKKKKEGFVRDLHTLALKKYFRHRDYTNISPQIDVANRSH